MEFNMTDDNNFTFKDFLPDVRMKGGFFTSSTFNNFGTLVDRANKFLRGNQKWEIVTCESVEFKVIDDLILSEEMTYLDMGTGTTSYVRGLRLWLKEKEDGSVNEQQIGYVNLIPEQLNDGGVFNSPEFESLDTVIEKFNSMQRSNPVPGRIITIESQEMKDSSYREFDPDRTKWSEMESRNKYFIFVLRIFYDKMADRSEEIGVKDFIPRQISAKILCRPPKYEQFSTVAIQASTWLAQQQHLRFCNAQTLEIKLKKGTKLDAQRMHYTEHGSNYTYYARVLRIAYTKPFIEPDSTRENSTPIIGLTYKTFHPVQLITGCCPEYENLVDTRKRISAWVKATGARVLSAETRIYPLQEKSETTSTVKVTKTPENWVFVIRLYLDGDYKEPPPEMLPALPIVKRCCLVS